MTSPLPDQPLPPPPPDPDDLWPPIPEDVLTAVGGPSLTWSEAGLTDADWLDFQAIINSDLVPGGPGPAEVERIRYYHRRLTSPPQTTQEHS